MSRVTTFVNSPIGKNVTSAAVAGVVAYVGPRRIPKWVRRGLIASNTAGSGVQMLAGGTAKSAADGNPAPLAGLLGSKAAPLAGAAGTLATLTGGLGLVTSSIGLRAESRAADYLAGRGVRHPRIWLAVGAAAVVFTVGVVTERVNDAAERKAAELQERLDGTNGKPGSSTPTSLPRTS